MSDNQQPPSVSGQSTSTPPAAGTENEPKSIASYFQAANDGWAKHLKPVESLYKQNTPPKALERPNTSTKEEMTTKPKYVFGVTATPFPKRIDWAIFDSGDSQPSENPTPQSHSPRMAEKPLATDEIHPVSQELAPEPATVQPPESPIAAEDRRETSSDNGASNGQSETVESTPISQVAEEVLVETEESLEAQPAELNKVQEASEERQHEGSDREDSDYPPLLDALEANLFGGKKDPENAQVAGREAHKDGGARNDESVHDDLAISIRYIKTELHKYTQEYSKELNFEAEQITSIESQCEILNDKVEEARRGYNEKVEVFKQRYDSISPLDLNLSAVSMLSDILGAKADLKRKKRYLAQQQRELRECKEIKRTMEAEFSRKTAEMKLVESVLDSLAQNGQPSKDRLSFLENENAALKKELSEGKAGGKRKAEDDANRSEVDGSPASKKQKTQTQVSGDADPHADGDADGEGLAEEALSVNADSQPALNDSSAAGQQLESESLEQSSTPTSPAIAPRKRKLYDSDVSSEEDSPANKRRKSASPRGRALPNYPE